MPRREFITFLEAAAAVWKRAKKPTAWLREAGYLLLGLVSLATVTGLYFWLDVSLVAAAFTYLVVLVLLSLLCNFYSLIVLSFIGVCCLSYFFAPPIFSFRVDYPQDLITISAFLITSFVVNFLVTRVRVEQRNHMRAPAPTIIVSSGLLHRLYEDEPDKSGRGTIADESCLFPMFPAVPTPLHEIE